MRWAISSPWNLSSLGSSTRCCRKRGNFSRACSLSRDNERNRHLIKHPQETWFPQKQFALVLIVPDCYRDSDSVIFVKIGQLHYRTANRTGFHKGIFIDTNVLGQRYTFLLDIGSGFAVSILSDDLWKSHFDKVENIPLMKTSLLENRFWTILERGFWL